jgi:hypothetical protein
MSPPKDAKWWYSTSPDWLKIEGAGNPCLGVTWGTQSLNHPKWAVSKDYFGPDGFHNKHIQISGPLHMRACSHPYINCPNYHTGFSTCMVIAIIQWTQGLLPPATMSSLFEPSHRPWRRSLWGIVFSWTPKICWTNGRLVPKATSYLKRKSAGLPVCFVDVLVTHLVIALTSPIDYFSTDFCFELSHLLLQMFAFAAL